LVACGFGLIAVGWHLNTRGSYEERMKAAHPDAPWMWQRQWAGGRIRGFGKPRVARKWVAAVTLLSIAGASVPLLRELYAGGNQTILWFLIFHLCALHSLLSAMRASWRARKFGIAQLTLEPVPGGIGGHLLGIVQAEAVLPRGTEMHLRLVCSKEGVTPSGADPGQISRPQASILWEEQQVISAEDIHRGRRGSYFRVKVRIPNECHASGSFGHHKSICWQLELVGKGGGANFKTSFEVPVFRTEISALDSDEATPERPSFEAAGADGELLAGSNR
jgi:hypothetical protein